MELGVWCAWNAFEGWWPSCGGVRHGSNIWHVQGATYQVIQMRVTRLVRVACIRARFA